MTTDSHRLTTQEFVPPLAMEISPASFQIISTLLCRRKQFILDNYKDKCVRRRITLRIRATRCDTAEEYCRILQEDETEIDRLLRVLTIHVSQFFRNFSMFEKLRREVLPGLIQRCVAAGNGPLRMLSIGCACGEEPYSLAILLRESFPAELAASGAQIIGIDIDGQTLEAARAARYTEDRLKELAPATVSRFFSVVDNRYVLNDEVRELVSFKRPQTFST